MCGLDTAAFYENVKDKSLRLRGHKPYRANLASVWEARGW